jgi:HNH endonuclease
MMRRTLLRSKPKRGSGIRPEQREAVLLRDGHHCRRCGRSVVDFPASVHHRLMRSRGGTDNLANLLLVCGSGTTYCHGDVHHEVTDSTADGFLCHTWENPAEVAVLTVDGWRLFGDDGSVTPVAGRRWEAQE